jgi:hypothetical protein
MARLSVTLDTDELPVYTPDSDDTVYDFQEYCNRTRVEPPAEGQLVLTLSQFLAAYVTPDYVIDGLFKRLSLQLHRDDGRRQDRMIDGCARAVDRHGSHHEFQPGWSRLAGDRQGFRPGKRSCRPFAKRLRRSAAQWPAAFHRTARRCRTAAHLGGRHPLAYCGAGLAG